MKMIRIIGKKTLYNLDNEQTARNWAIEPVKKLKTYDMPNMSSGVKVKTEGNTYGKNFPGSFGYIMAHSNNIEQNTMNTALFSAAASKGHGFGINKDNFDRCTILFSARCLIKANWINSKDEYLAPDESNPNYEEFVNDSIVFSMFHIHSNQSSLRNIEYKNKENNNE